MFLAVRTTFMYASSHNDFAVFALESTVDCGSGFFVDVGSPFCVLCFVSERWITDFHHFCLDAIVLPINFFRVILTRLACLKMLSDVSIY